MLNMVIVTRLKHSTLLCFLVEISPNPEYPSPVELFQEAIEVARTHYNNQHVYPYTYLGGYMYRHKRFPQAIHAWAQAAAVIKG